MLFGLTKRPLIMGILNVTPDSFSGDGLLAHDNYVAAAVDLAMQMVADGADLLDIGGESSRPGSELVSAEEEIRRTAPVIAAIKKNMKDRLSGGRLVLPPLRGELEGGSVHAETTPHPTSPSRGEEHRGSFDPLMRHIPISIDTTKASVAEAALDAGASIINDISAMQADPAMVKLAAKRSAWVVLMHNRSNPAAVARDAKIGGEYDAPVYEDIVEDVLRDLRERAAFAESAGIAHEKIILDPGVGFGKTVEQNLKLSRDIPQLQAAGYPVLIGNSRKSFIGRVLDLPVDERLEGTAALTAIASFQGADIIRVHDVKFMARVAKMAAAICSAV